MEETFELQNAKGTRDFEPEEKAIREQVIAVLRETFEEYGFRPLETPIINRLDVLTAKYAGGSEILKEVFQLQDQGGRKLALRYDLTVPMCKFVGMNPQLRMPFKRYEIGRVYRDGPIKLGRYREFWQCDADVVGTTNPLADAESIALMSTAFKKLQLNAYIEVNSRKVLEGILDFAGIQGEQRTDAMIALDKIKKVGEDEVRKEMESKGISDDGINKLFSAILVSGSNQEMLETLKNTLQNEAGKEGLQEMQAILGYLEVAGITNARFIPSLARGLAYYTGPVFEAFIEGSKVTSSVAGGGRYDKIIGGYLGGKREYPATGFSFGLDTIVEVLKLERKLEVKSLIQLYVIPIGTPKESFRITQQLREACIKCDLDLGERGISKNLDYANALGIPYVLLVGEDELKAGKFKLKNMKEGSEEMLTLEEVKRKLKRT